MFQKLLGSRDNLGDTGHMGSSRSHGSGREHVKGSNTHMLAHNATESWRRGRPRPSMSTFLEVQPSDIPKQQDDMTTHIKKYRALEQEDRGTISFPDYCEARSKNMPNNKTPKEQQNFDLICKVRRFTIPLFDGFTQHISRACETCWTKHETIKLAMLHLNGEDCEWL